MLLDGECVSEGDCIASGGIVEGSGQFRKTCVPTTSTTQTTVDMTPQVCEGLVSTLGRDCQCEGGCHTCDYTGGVAGACTKCKNALVLLDSVCQDSSECTALGGIIEGKGQFGLECVVPESTTEGTTTALVPKTCVGRTTDDVIPEPCVCESDCHTCRYDGGVARECQKCKNTMFLESGACITDIECIGLGGSLGGSGRFGRTCDI